MKKQSFNNGCFQIDWMTGLGRYFLFKVLMACAWVSSNKPSSCRKPSRLEPICLSIMSLTFWRLRTFFNFFRWAFSVSS